jgi:hypothetical protein
VNSTVEARAFRFGLRHRAAHYCPLPPRALGQEMAPRFDGEDAAGFPPGKRVDGNRQGPALRQPQLIDTHILRGTFAATPASELVSLNRGTCVTSFPLSFVQARSHGCRFGCVRRTQCSRGRIAKAANLDVADRPPIKPGQSPPQGSGTTVRLRAELGWLAVS